MKSFDPAIMFNDRSVSSLWYYATYVNDIVDKSVAIDSENAVDCKCKSECLIPISKTHTLQNHCRILEQSQYTKGHVWC